MFDLVRKTPLKEYDGEGLFYVHKATGMEVFHVKNSDPELTCSFIFSTPSEDDKGIAHIIEHTVLNGSERFPVKDPFSQVAFSSPNTFLNAVTFGDKTMYPISSPLKKDFDNLFDIYADAVFAPLLRKNSFLQEGIRLFDGQADGVVFNEMSGSCNNEDSILQDVLTRTLYEGTPYQYVSGGDPLSIVNLTYDQYLARYKKWYCPTNCKLFLFGALDTQEYLDKLEDRYLKKAQKGEKIIPYSENYEQKQLKPTYKVVGCPSPEVYSVVLSWLTTPSSDPLEILTASILVDVLLGNPGAPLYKAIIESGLGEDLNAISGTDTDSPMLTFTVGFSKAQKGKEKEIEDFLLGTLKKFVEEGLPQEAVEAAIKRQEFKIQEIPGDGLPFGISTCLKAARSWLRGKTPEEGIRDTERLAKFKELMKSGNYLENWMKKNLLENPRRVLVSVVFDSNYEENYKAEMQKRIAQMPLPTVQEKAEFESFVATADSPEALATIGRITRDDIPLNLPKYKQLECHSKKGAKLYVLQLFTRSIVYLKYYFDIRNLNEEEIKLLPLLLRLLNMCGTKKHNYSEYGTALKRFTGSFSITANFYRNLHDKPLCYVMLKTKTLKADFPQALDLIDELLLTADLRDTARIKASLNDLLSDYQNSYIYNASSFAALNASSGFSATGMASEHLMGTEGWLNMQALKKSLGKNKAAWTALSVRLTKLYKKIFTQKALTLHLGCESPARDKVKLLLSHINRYPEGQKVRTSNYFNNGFSVELERKLTQSPDSTNIKRALVVPSGPAFNALVVRLPELEEREKVSAILLGHVLTSGYLWNEVRGKNGAYGVSCRYDEMEKLIAFSSYRDPGVEGTIEAFLEALKSPISEEELEYCVVSVLGRDVRPLTPQAKCQEAFSKLLFTKSEARYLRRRQLLLSTTVEDLKALAAKILEQSEKLKVQVTVCGKELAEKSDFQKCVLLPL